MGMVLKKLKRDRVGKEREINQRKERGLKKENLERKRVRGSKANGNPKHVKLTNWKYKTEKRNKTVKEKTMQREGTSRKTKRTEKRS